MRPEFSPITLGERLRSVDARGFTLTETTHPPNHELPRHSHERANLAFVLSGSFSEYLDRRFAECKPHSVVIKPAGEAHANRYGNKGVRCLLVELQPQQLEALHPWSKAFAQPSYIQGGILAVLATRIYSEFRHMDQVAPIAIEGLMFEIIAALSRRDCLCSGRKSPRWLAQAKDILHVQFNESISVSSVARAVGVHPVHLAREFHKYFRCSVGEYVRRLRIESACRELSNSDNSLVEIALKSGFTHQAHFSRVFKKHTGMTPSEYRFAIRSR